MALIANMSTYRSDLIYIYIYSNTHSSPSVTIAKGVRSSSTRLLVLCCTCALAKLNLLILLFSFGRVILDGDDAVCVKNMVLHILKSISFQLILLGD